MNSLSDTFEPLNQSFWPGRSVFMTGHTGFKGSWASLLLSFLGAKVHGYSLPPSSTNDLFVVGGVEENVSHTLGNILDFDDLLASMKRARPEIIVHMAAQSLVRLSYERPVDTYAVNVMGTVHVLEAARQVGGVKAVIVVTSDKCYDNKEWSWGYRENDRLGGYDPYSNSKACAELVSACYRKSFSSGESPDIVTVRAGNVIGGGDWAQDRLVPDAMRAFSKSDTVRIRNPMATRPWQHVLEPVTGYLLLAERIATGSLHAADSFNFGPGPESELPVGQIIERLATLWGSDAHWNVDAGPHPHEASYLKLDCSRARQQLGWSPKTTIEEALEMSVGWYRAHLAGSDMKQFTLNQIRAFGRVSSPKIEH